MYDGSDFFVLHYLRQFTLLVMPVYTVSNACLHSKR